MSLSARRGTAAGLDRSATSRGLEIVAVVRASGPFGDERTGLVVAAARWEPAIASELDRLPAHFRIVLLREPVRSVEPIPERTVVCIPAPPLPAPKMREPAAEYVAGPRDAARTAAELLAHGTLVSPVRLEVKPEQVFAGGGEPDFEPLARDLLFGPAVAETFAALALALSAPEPPQVMEHAGVLKALRELAADARGALGTEADAPLLASAALERIVEAAAAEDGRAFIVAAGRVYGSPSALVEETYLLRALADDVESALDVLRMSGYVEAAAVPGDDHDLVLDRAIAREQLRFASVAPEPARVPTAVIAFENFRKRFQQRYIEHHRAYWHEVDQLHDLLVGAAARVRSLGHLNSLTELGPPVGERALERYGELLKEATGCPFSGDLQAVLAEAPACPGCGRRLDDAPPGEAVRDVLGRIERAIARQLSRLSSVAVRQVLERSHDPRVERFLKIVQASSVASLPEVLDEELVGYLRRFLVEARIATLLEPMLEAVQQGSPPDAGQADKASREMAAVLERALRAGQRSLPAPKRRGRGNPLE